MITQFIIGFLVYGVLALASYSESIKSSMYYYPIGIVAAIVANLCWLSIAKGESDPSKLVITGLYWDVMLTLVYIVVPFVLFGAKVNMWQGLGIAAIIMGIVLTKVG